MADQTEQLRAWMKGDEQARSALFESAHDEMHKIAVGMLRHDRQRQALQPTELVNECVIRMFGLRKIEWRDRAHFAAIAATTMRRVLVDEARRRGAHKRDGMEVTLATAHLGQESQDIDVIELDTALKQLKETSPELVEVVELKFFGGLTNEEAGAVLGISEASVKRRWRAARAWLYAQLDESSAQSD